MKKIISVFIFLCLLISFVSAEVVLLNGVETTGVSSALIANYTGMHTVACHFTNSGGSVTALTIDLEGSNDNTHWHTLKSYALNSSDTTELTNKKAMYHMNNKRVNYVRVNISTLTETGTTSVYVSYYDK